jgi:hypothetical protein
METGGYRLAVRGEAIDLVRFDAALTAARITTNPESALDYYANALDCWRGSVLADLSSEFAQLPAAVAA